MKIVTCISDSNEYGYKYYLKPSCEHFNLTLITLEVNSKWSTHRIKDFCLLKYLKDLRNDEIIVFTDGYDTMFTCGEDEIYAKYAAFNKPLVFTAEKNCWPYQKLSEKYPASDYPFRYLNCGGFIGKASVIGYLLEKYPVPPSGYNFLQKMTWKAAGLFTKKEMDPDKLYQWSNQYYWTHVYLAHHDSIALDYRCELFLELAPPVNFLIPNLKQFRNLLEASELYKQEMKRLESECLFRDNKLFHVPTHSMPCQVHFNSPVTKHIALNKYFKPIMPWL